MLWDNQLSYWEELELHELVLCPKCQAAFTTTYGGCHCAPEIKAAAKEYAKTVLARA